MKIIDLKVIELIKTLIVVFVILAGISIFSSALASQANNERSYAYDTRRFFILAGHELRVASLELTRLARAYIVMGTESQLELYWEELLVLDRLGTIRQMFVDNNASPHEIYLLDKALSYQEILRAIDALAIQARISGDYQLALDITYGANYAAYGAAFVVLVNELNAATLARAEKMVEHADNRASFFQNLALATSILFGLISAPALFFILHEVKTAMQREREANELNEIILNSAPFIMNVWDESFKLLSTSQQAVKTFGLSSQKQYMERFFDLSPVQQPNGINSTEKIMDYIKETILYDRRFQFEWMHQTLNGEPVPSEVTLIRFKRQDKYFLAAYTVDLRPIKQETQRMLAEMRRREIAEEESQAKTRFLAQMSHEIRTPMNAVLGITEIQLQKEGHPLDTEEAFLRIQSSGSLLLTIINDILDLSKVEAGKMEIIPESYEVASLIVDTVQLNIMRVGSKNIEFKLKVDENLPSYLIGDELRIKQILNNILSNAFKYTNEGFVSLFIGMEDTRQTTDNIILVLRVEDSGQGMTNEQISSLNTEFARFNLQNNRIIEGSGLGMTIAFQLAKMMEGSIHVESELDRGSTFTVCLPQKPDSTNTLGRETADNLQNFEISQKSLRRISRHISTPMPYGRVLVVDDVESNLYVVKGLLMPYKIAVEIVTDGPAAIDKVKAGEVYDIIFMDHMMPGMDGIEATKIIRNMGYEHPIVALTANALKGVLEMFLNNGFNGFLPKPINLDQFNACLVQYIRDKQPPEVLKAAEMRYGDEKSTGNLLDNLRESFLLDARKAIGILEPLIQKQELDKEELKAFSIQTHAMKSALYNIGRMELSKAAFALETASRTADMKAVCASTPKFLSDLKEIVKELSLKNISHDMDDEDMDFLKAQLDTIKEACKNLDPNTANNTLDILNRRQYSIKTKELIKNISTHLLYGDFDEAAALAGQAASIIHAKKES